MAVYLALQKSVCEESGQQDKTVAVQKCGNPPYELSLRFAGCNLKCGACFASAYSWPEKYRSSRRVKVDIPIERLMDDFNKIPKSGKSYNWMRILGGEPLLNEEYIHYLFTFIERIARGNTKCFNNGIVIQTNGLYLGLHDNKLIESYLRKIHTINPSLKIAIEISIKGSNPDEFSLLSQSSRDLFHANITAYKNLKKIESDNLRPTVIAGFGINESYLLSNGKSKKSMMTIISRDNIPIYHPDIWADEFRALYYQFVDDWKNNNSIFSKMPMYGIKDEFNYNWVKYALRQAKNIYGTVFYDSAYSTHNEVIENKISELLEYFFLVSNQEYYSELIK